MLLIVFVHYNKYNQLDEYVKYYLDKLLEIKEKKKVVFVSTSKLSSVDKNDLITKNIEVIERENVGYDFYSYKVGVEHGYTEDVNSILICNDSVFGPLYDINSIYNSMQNDSNDIVAISDNNEFIYHLQSYFVIFKENVIKDKSFKKFWNDVKILSGRDEVIQTYELGMSKYFIENGYKLGAYNKLLPSCLNVILYGQKKQWMLARCFRYFRKGMFQEASAINVTHHLWEHLITRCNFPFIKRELIDKNPENLSLENLNDLVQTHTDYPVNLFNRKKIN